MDVYLTISADEKDLFAFWNDLSGGAKLLLVLVIFVLFLVLTLHAS